MDNGQKKVELKKDLKNRGAKVTDTKEKLIEAILTTITSITYTWDKTMHPQDNEKIVSIKCQKCRHVLLEDAQGTNNNFGCSAQKCSSYNVQNIMYLIEDKLPNWIKLKVEDENWTKGKLHCENCGHKVGSFDFVSGRKCDCRDSVLPPVHFITSQVDIPISLLKLK